MDRVTGLRYSIVQLELGATSILQQYINTVADAKTVLLPQLQFSPNKTVVR